VAIPQLERQRGPNRPVEIARVQQVNWFPYTLAILLGMLGLVLVPGALVVVNLAALLPGWVAGRADPAVALRSE